MTSLAARISQRRSQLKMSQEELAQLIGTSQKQISRYERGENDVTGDVLLRLADALETTADWLLGRVDDPSRPLRTSADLTEIEREIISTLRSKNTTTTQRLLDLLKAM